MSLTAAHAARIEAALDKPFRTDDHNTTYREALASGLIVAGRIREFSTGKRTYGVILADDFKADDPFYSSFYDAPKLVVDQCPQIVTNA